MFLKSILYAPLAVIICLGSALAQHTVVVKAQNRLDRWRAEEPVVVSRQALGANPDEAVLEVILSREGLDWPLPFQMDDLDGDGTWDELFFQVRIGPRETLPLRVTLGPKPEKPPRFPKRVAALIDAAPREPWAVHKPVWESELIGYCTYGSAQIDLLGKIQPRLVLEYYFGKEPQSQHRFTSDYGQDFLTTGNTMGAHAIFVKEPNGNIARPWTTNAYSIRTRLERDAKFESKVVANGPLRAIVQTKITNWVTDAGTYECEILYSISAMKRHTDISLRFTKFPPPARSLKIGAGMRQMYEDIHYEKTGTFMTAIASDVLEAGIVDRLVARAILTPGRLATQEIRIPHDSALKDIPFNGPNYGLLFPPGTTKVRYAFTSAWEKDGGITSVEQWRSYLQQLAEELDSPLAITVDR